MDLLQGVIMQDNINRCIYYLLMSDMYLTNISVKVMSV